MNSLPRIPRPLGQRWRDFQLKGLSFIVFAAVAVVAAFLWKGNPMPSAFVGEVQPIESIVASLKPGLLADLKVDQFDRVKAGQVLGTVQVVSPDSIQAELAAIKTDLQVSRVQLRQNQERTDVNYQQLRMDLLVQKIDLATAAIRLQQAESEFQRVSRLYREQLVPQGLNVSGDVRNEFGYDVALRDRDALQKDIEERTRLVTEIEQALPTLRSPGGLTVNDALDAAIAAQEQKLRQVESPVLLKAPLDGSVIKVNRRVGENVAAGEPLLVVRAEKADRILGFMRQPLTTVPQENDLVEVRTRGHQRQVGVARVLKIGAGFELFSAPLRVRGLDAAMERGLPVLVSVPENLRVFPGEYVDLFPRAAR